MKRWLEAEGLQNRPKKLTAVTVWSAVHGLIALLLEGQVPHTVMEQYSLCQMFVFTLNHLRRPGFSYEDVPVTL